LRVAFHLRSYLEAQQRLFLVALRARAKKTIRLPTVCELALMHESADSDDLI